MSTSTTQQLSYWSNLNALWESSGLPQQKFCEQEGVKYKQFVYWRGRISAKHSGKRHESKPRLLKVSIPLVSESAPTTSEVPPRLEVVMPTGVKLYIKTETDISKAGALIKLLGGAS